ncbi:Mechanosensitive ion channel [hydrothermal vent metagenome]|uniref:Mechanosensitive ion channel n=1 Tax=hydrothermal vent metagenome TaxID=652676 RepID=A0A1W1EE43_9ZZZZ
MKIEAQLSDRNTSELKINDLIKQQEIEYKNFFLSYASKKEENIQKNINLYSKIDKLKISNRKKRKEQRKIDRLISEIDLQTVKMEIAMKAMLYKSLILSNNKSIDFYQDKLSEEIDNIYKKYEPLDKSKFLLNSKDDNSTVLPELVKPLNNLNIMKNLVNTFTIQLINNSENIYKTALLSESKFFSYMDSINRSEMGENLNRYLIYMNLDTGKVLSILILIVLIILIQKLIIYLSNLLCKHFKMTEDDIKYVNTHITKIFVWLTTLMIIHLVLVMFAGMQHNSPILTQGFSIVYVILVSILIFRSIHSFAYFKIRSIKQHTEVKDEVFNLSIKAIYLLIILIAIIFILKIFGVDLTALLSGLGIAGAAVAFAAKDTIANVFGSIAILIGDIFEQGDWIETDTVDGTVVEIGLRATTIRTFDNALISVPNVELSNNGVKNWSRRSIGRRIKMSIGVTYESDFDDIKKAIEEIKKMLKIHPGIANEHTSYSNKYRQAKLVSTEDLRGIKRTTLVYLDEFSDSSINILLYCFSRTVDWNEWLKVKEDVMFKIAEILKENNLEFAYPTMTLHQAKQLEDKEDKRIS